MHSTVKATICFVILMVRKAVTDIAGECDMASFYLELGCTAVPRADNSSICPQAFTCPDLHPDPTMCYYRGVSYADRSAIPQTLISNPCSQACSCTLFNGEPRFECAAVDCVETFDDDIKQQCINTYDLDSCCSTGTVCGKDAVAKLKSCEVDGKIYREGETFEPFNTRKTCVCTADWNGSTDNSAYCRDINCGIEIHFQDKIFENCAPIFTTNMRSCPIEFECPSASSKIIRGLNVRNLDSKCVFGNMTLSVGDEVSADEKCTTCLCNIPPFVNCMKKNVCDEQ